MTIYRWPIVVLVLGGAIILLSYRLASKYVNGRLQALEASGISAEAKAIERRTAAKLNEATLEQRVELEKLQLRKQHADALAVALRSSELEDDRLEAERRAIKAYGEAKEQLAEELVRADAAATRSSNLVARYEQYLTVSRAAGKSTYSIGDFATTLRNYGEAR